MLASYTDSVFINCPFDVEYEPLLKGMLFTIYRCGFVPRSAMEEDDASDIRIEKITRLISMCKFGIHDISRTELDKKHGLPRFNMPFELGLFWGAKKWGKKLSKEKVALIFEKEQYTYQKYFSDLNGADIKAHNNNVEQVIKAVRNWLRTTSGRSSIPTAALIIKDYIDFEQNRLPVMLKESGATVQDLTFNDYCAYVNAALTAKMLVNKKRFE